MTDYMNDADEVVPAALRPMSDAPRDGTWVLARLVDVPPPYAPIIVRYDAGPGLWLSPGSRWCRERDLEGWRPLPGMDGWRPTHRSAYDTGVLVREVCRTLVSIYGETPGARETIEVVVIEVDDPLHEGRQVNGLSAAEFADQCESLTEGE